MNGKKEFGDYQTPLSFAEKVCKYLKYDRGIRPSVVIEPTCGLGNFIRGGLIFDANEYYGIEINPEYCAACCNSIKDERVKIINSDFFAVTFKNLIKSQSQILIIGNPPWVTNSTLSALGSENLPVKSNFKGLKGIDAITGASNFDICEYIILKLINEYRNTNTVISMLCKTNVARNVFKELKRSCINFKFCDILDFDALKVFGINASACILLIQLTSEKTSPDVCSVYDFDNNRKVKMKLKYSENHIYSDLLFDQPSFEGECCFEWHQGVKHDCAKIMELISNGGIFRNGKADDVEIENDIVFPLVKSSMFKKPIIHSFSKYVIVTQKKAGNETNYLKYAVPKTWKYLNDNREFFDRRKSSIYCKAPLFSMFGVGEYSFSKYKVGVSGFYKRPLFSVLYSDDNKPVMIDDTGYFISFDTYNMAYAAMLLLNSVKVQEFLMKIAFLDAKRPFTKKVLERIDFNKITENISLEELEDTEQKLGLTKYITDVIYERFKTLISVGQLRFNNSDQVSGISVSTY